MNIHTHNFEKIFPNTIAFQTFRNVKVKGKPEPRNAMKKDLGIEGGGFSSISYYTIDEVLAIATQKVKDLGEDEKGHLYIGKWEKIKKISKRIKENS
jgi:hypothetical protein